MSKKRKTLVRPRYLSTLDRIVFAAVDVFGEYGLSATMEDVAWAAGLSKRTVYDHFESKRELIDTAAYTLSSRKRGLARLLRSLEVRSNNPEVRLLLVSVLTSKASRNGHRKRG